MARGACSVLDVREGLIVAPEDSSGPLPTLAASHPVPDARSEAAGRALLELAKRAKGQVLALVSGGGSSLVAVPAPSLTLADKVDATRKLHAAGAAIAELNTVRQALSDIKGGKLAAACLSPMVTLICSDVVGDDSEVVASGPTVVRSARNAVEICKAYGIWDGLNTASRACLSASDREPPASLHPDSRVKVIAPLDSVARTTQIVAGERGIATRLDRRAIVGPVGEAAIGLESILDGLAPGELYVGYGEVTLKLPESPGIGGRAQHLALLMADRIAGSRARVLVAGTDGVDGNSVAAGAVVDGKTWAQLRSAGVDPEASLRRRDAHTALSVLGATIETGPTGVNHADLVLMVVEPTDAV